MTVKTPPCHDSLAPDAGLIRRHPEIRPSTVIYASYGVDVPVTPPRAISAAAWDQGMAESRGAFDTLWATRLGWTECPATLADLLPELY